MCKGFVLLFEAGTLVGIMVAEWKWRRVRVGSYRYVLMVDGVQQGPVNAWTIKLVQTEWIVRNERGKIVGREYTLDTAKELAQYLRTAGNRKSEQERRIRQRMTAETEAALRQWEKWREEHPASRTYVDVDTGEYL